MTARTAAMPARQASTFEVIPSIDLLGGRVVRLTRGEFATAHDYGSPVDVVSAWNLPAGARLHVVDLEGSRRGSRAESSVIAALHSLGLSLQIGGGIRSVEDAMRWIDAGAARVVIGTVAALDPQLLTAISRAIGGNRIVVAIDVLGDVVRVAGWEQSAQRSIDEVLRGVEDAGVPEVLVTDVSADGTLLGPSLDLYESLVTRTTLRVCASGGVGQPGDVTSLARIDGLAGVIVGKALHEGLIRLGDAQERAVSARLIPERVIPCLDMRNGRVVKGVRFEGIRDAGDPVDCVRRYEDEGADEIVVLDISATEEERSASIAMINQIAASLFIPLTVGGGVRDVPGFRRILEAGADRVAINTAAIVDPELLTATSEEFGVQAVVLACDALAEGTRWKVVTHAGKRQTLLDVADWCAEGERLGAGEILLTSIDRDGTGSGYDIALLRSVTSRIGIGVIASGGAGQLAHFSEAVRRGGARAVLAASLFHDGILTIGEVKRSLRKSGVPVRLSSSGEPKTFQEDGS